MGVSLEEILFEFDPNRSSEPKRSSSSDDSDTFTPLLFFVPELVDTGSGSSDGLGEISESEGREGEGVGKIGGVVELGGVGLKCFLLDSLG